MLSQGTAFSLRASGNSATTDNRSLVGLTLLLVMTIFWRAPSLRSAYSLVPVERPFRFASKLLIFVLSRFQPTPECGRGRVCGSLFSRALFLTCSSCHHEEGFSPKRDLFFVAAGETMSARIFAVPLPEPIQAFRST